MKDWIASFVAWLRQLIGKPTDRPSYEDAGQVKQILVFGLASARAYWNEHDLPPRFLECLERRILFLLMPIVVRNEHRLEELADDLRHMIGSLLRAAMNKCSAEND